MLGILTVFEIQNRSYDLGFRAFTVVSVISEMYV